MGFTLLETRQKIHMCRGGLYAICGSRAEVLGFQYRDDGEFTLPASALDLLCPKCVKHLGLTVEAS